MAPNRTTLGGLRVGGDDAFWHGLGESVVEIEPHNRLFALAPPPVFVR